MEGCYVRYMGMLARIVSEGFGELRIKILRTREVYVLPLMDPRVIATPMRRVK